MTPEQVAAAMTAEGLLLESSDNLSQNTEYEFGIYAANEEGVGVSVVHDLQQPHCLSMMVMESGLNFLGNILLLLKMLRARM